MGVDVDTEPHLSFIFECEIEPPLDWPLPPAESLEYLEGPDFNPHLPLGRVEKAEVRETEEGKFFVDIFFRDVQPTFIQAVAAKITAGSAKITCEIDPDGKGYSYSSEVLDVQNECIQGMLDDMLKMVFSHVASCTGWSILAPKNIKRHFEKLFTRVTDWSTMPNKERPLRHRSLRVDFDEPREVQLSPLTQTEADVRNKLSQTADIPPGAKAGRIDSIMVHRCEANISVTVRLPEEERVFWLEFQHSKQKNEFSVRPNGSFQDAAQDPLILAVKNAVVNHPDWPLLNPEGARWPA